VAVQDDGGGIAGPQFVEEMAHKGRLAESGAAVYQQGHGLPAAARPRSSLVQKTKLRRPPDERKIMMVAAADTWLRGQIVKVPEKMVEVLMPGFG